MQNHYGPNFQACYSLHCWREQPPVGSPWVLSGGSVNNRTAVGVDAWGLHTQLKHRVLFIAVQQKHCGRFQTLCPGVNSSSPEGSLSSP